MFDITKAMEIKLFRMILKHSKIILFALSKCAILSPAFKVREFSITDVVPYSISLKWNSAAEDGLKYGIWK